MMMIRLTPAQAASVRGLTSDDAGLDPVQMAAVDGVATDDSALPVRVLDDPAHEIRWAFLDTLPQIDSAAITWPDS